MTEAGGLILLYHRVTTLDTDPQLLAVTPEDFAEQMEVLRSVARPMALGEMVAAVRRGEDLRGAVAVTFDDGYADNLLEAKPILQSEGIPATVFVSTGGTDARREFFWDELERICLQPGRLPERLRLTVGDSVYEADLGNAAEYSLEEWGHTRGWNVTVLENPTARHRVYREVCGLIHRATNEQRRMALRRIQQWSGLGCEGRVSHRMMSGAQLRELADGDLIEVGGHTINHPLLAVEQIEDQKQEIAGGKAALEAVLGRAVWGFSYPFGGRRDYNPESVAAVREAGFEYACSNFNGWVDAQTDPFQLPRVLVRDWGSDEFQTRLAGWMHRA